jgi:hypothetical protein
LAAQAQAAFFSYSRDDSEFALRLAADLKAAGANVWLDQMDIAPGQRWARAVQEALNNCHRLLVILSPSSVSSTNVEDEVAFALEEHKTVIPVFYRDCKVPFQLRPFQFADFRTDYNRGLKTLLRTLGAEQEAVAAEGAAASAIPKDAAAGISGADNREPAAERQRLEQQEKQAAEQARLEKQERERLAAEERGRQQKLEQAAAEHARAGEECHLAADKAQREELERQPEAPTEKAALLSQKKTIIGLTVGVVVLLLTWILWPRGSGHQASQLQSNTAEQHREQQTTAPQTQSQSSEQQPQRTEPAPEAVGKVPQSKPTTGSTDVRKSVAKSCPEGVHCDSHANLMWTIKDNGNNISWVDADRYCKKLTLAGLSGWELPTIDELERLHDPLYTYDPQNSPNKNILKPFRLTGDEVWSSTKESLAYAWFFSFYSGLRYSSSENSSTNRRALCVRRFEK